MKITNTSFYNYSKKPTLEQLFSNLSVHDPKSYITSSNNPRYMHNYNNFSQVCLIILAVHDPAKGSYRSLEYPTFKHAVFYSPTNKLLHMQFWIMFSFLQKVTWNAQLSINRTDSVPFLIILWKTAIGNTTEYNTCKSNRQCRQH